MSSLDFGTHVRDSVSGFEGVVIARAEYQHEVPSVLVCAVTQQMPSDSRWIAESRCEPTGKSDPQPTGFGA